MKKFFTVSLTVMMVLLAGLNLYAQTELPYASMQAEGALRPLPRSYFETLNQSERQKKDTFGYKLGLGLTNVATSWTEVPVCINEISKERGAFEGYNLGFGKGIVSGVVRGISGAVDTATFGMPPYDQQLMDPEYKVDNPDKEGYIITLFKW